MQPSCLSPWSQPLVIVDFVKTNKLWLKHVLLKNSVKLNTSALYKTFFSQLVPFHYTQYMVLVGVQGVQNGGPPFSLHAFKNVWGFVYDDCTFLWLHIIW